MQQTALKPITTIATSPQVVVPHPRLYVATQVVSLPMAPTLLWICTTKAEEMATHRKCSVLFEDCANEAGFFDSGLLRSRDWHLRLGQGDLKPCLNLLPSILSACDKSDAQCLRANFPWHWFSVHQQPSRRDELHIDGLELLPAKFEDQVLLENQLCQGLSELVSKWYSMSCYFMLRHVMSCCVV